MVKKCHKSAKKGETMARRNPNGYGSVVKLKGNRSKPFMACVSEMISEGIVIPFDIKKSLETKIEALEQASDIEEINSIYVELLSDLFSAVSVEDYRDMIVKEAKQKIDKRTFKAKQKKRPIGYFKTAQEANIALAEYNKSPYDLDNKAVTFGELYKLAYDDARIEKKSKSTQKGYSSAFGKCTSIADMPIKEIKHQHLQKIIDDNSQLSRSSLNNILSVYNLAYAFAIKNELMDKNAAEFVKIEEHKEKGEKMPFTREEVNYLWEHLDWRYDNGRKGKLNGETLSDILLILIYTGMRINELLSVKSSDVHLEERHINLLGTKTKSAKRLVPIHEKIIPLIESRLAMGGEYLIITQRGSKMTYDQLTSKMLGEFCKQNNMQHTFHEARHSFATYTKASNMDNTLRQFIMGHSNKDITDDVYTHPEVLLPELIAEIDKLEI